MNTPAASLLEAVRASRLAEGLSEFVRGRHVLHWRALLHPCAIVAPVSPTRPRPSEEPVQAVTDRHERCEVRDEQQRDEEPGRRWHHGDDHAEEPDRKEVGRQGLPPPTRELQPARRDEDEEATSPTRASVVGDIDVMVRGARYDSGQCHRLPIARASTVHRLAPSVGRRTAAPRGRVHPVDRLRGAPAGHAALLRRARVDIALLGA